MTDFQVSSHEIVTPISKQKVILKDFISGYDDEAIENIYVSGKIEVGADTKDQKFAIDGASIALADREGIKRVVLSVDGDNGDGRLDGIVDIVYSMHKDDTRFIKKAVNAIVNPTAETPEKKSSAAKSSKS